MQAGGRQMPNLVNTEFILDMQRKLYSWSRKNPDRVFSDLFNLVCDRRSIHLAWDLLCRNKGSQTPGTDGLTRRKVEERQDGVEGFLMEVETALRSGQYRPQPVRQRLIPKPGKPGKFRPLGIPTLTDRLVQMALKNVLEPIFESDFYPNSYGFRKGRSTLDALAIIKRQLEANKSGQSKFDYVIEGDIKGCFDNIDHHLLMERIRKRIGDNKVLRLILSFLKAGIMAEGAIRHPIAGTPQGGIISPLLSNIILTDIDARYGRWTPKPGEKAARAERRRYWDRQKGLPTFYAVRYADDFVILISGTYEDAINEKLRLATFLKEDLHLELSEEKTLVTKAEDGFEFLGYRVIKEPNRHGRMSGNLRIPPGKLKMIRHRIKQMTTRTSVGRPLEDILKEINPIITGWRNYYRYATGASENFYALDQWLWERIRLWMLKKHPKKKGREVSSLYARRVNNSRGTWGDGRTILRSFAQGGTKRYLCRGTRISNGWNNQIDGLRYYKEAARSNGSYSWTGKFQ
jgi:RNA-directed DNA polymerase